MNPISGIHHVTAIAGDPQRNLDFYTQVLGLRLVKLTVNFDDPGTYHFYFGDAAGRPGSILTFFPWQSARRGRPGLGQVSTVGYTIPAGSTGFWQERLKRLGASVSAPFTRFGEEVLPLLDPDGLPLELVASAPGGADQTWAANPVPTEQAIRGFAAPTLLVGALEPTAALLGKLFGMNQVQESGARYRFAAAGDFGALADVEVRPGEARGGMGSGVVHHIAWRAKDEAEQAAWRAELTAAGFEVTPVMDRQYFRSIYFREPGGILFEIATDPPGFTLDEPLEALGEQLRLPPWYEERRPNLLRILPPLRLPNGQMVAPESKPVEAR